MIHVRGETATKCTDCPTSNPSGVRTTRPFVTFLRSVAAATGELLESGNWKLETSIPRPIGCVHTPVDAPPPPNPGA